MQIINVYFGGTIIQDLPEHSQLVHAYSLTDSASASQKSYIRVCQTEIKSTPQKLQAEPFQKFCMEAPPLTNSAHHQGIDRAGDGLLIAQYSHDFVIEAMYHEHLPVIGVQWHPERMCFDFAHASMEDGSTLLRYFLSLL